MSKYQIDLNMGIHCFGERRIETCRLTAEGDTLGDLICSAEIHELDKAGDVVSSYEIQDCPSEEIGVRALALIEDEVGGRAVAEFRSLLKHLDTPTNPPPSAKLEMVHAVYVAEDDEALKSGAV